jgi:hypothetical protein
VATDGGGPATALLCFAPAGSAVVTGRGELVVWATGPTSTLGEIAGMAQGVERGRSLLERQVTQLSRVTAVIAVLTGALTLVLAALLSETTFLLALTFATGAIVALVPEGLLPTLSVALAIGARRMAARGGAVRRLAAIEIVGSVTTICTDKTGTLTENALVVRGFVGAAGEVDPSRDALLVATLFGDARSVDGELIGDLVDVALARWAISLGTDFIALAARHPRLADEPFTADRRYMRVTCLVDGERWDLIKGAPEAVVSLVDRDPPEILRAALAKSGGRGERVLLLAASPSGESLRAVGIVRLYDPPRPEVPASLAACRRAGVRVVMVTGDHPTTARAVAEQVGLGQQLPVVEGLEIDGLSDGELVERIRSGATFEPLGQVEVADHPVTKQERHPQERTHWGVMGWKPNRPPILGNIGHDKGLAILDQCAKQTVALRNRSNAGTFERGDPGGDELGEMPVLIGDAEGRKPGGNQVPGEIDQALEHGRELDLRGDVKGRNVSGNCQTGRVFVPEFALGPSARFIPSCRHVRLAFTDSSAMQLWLTLLAEPVNVLIGPVPHYRTRLSARGNGRVAGHALGDAPHEPSRRPGPSMGRHDWEVARLARGDQLWGDRPKPDLARGAISSLGEPRGDRLEILPGGSDFFREQGGHGRGAAPLAVRRRHILRSRLRRPLGAYQPVFRSGSSVAGSGSSTPARSRTRRCRAKRSMVPTPSQCGS